MSLMRVCDFCGEPCSAELELRRYRTQKVKRIFRGMMEWPAESWEEIDICDDCHNELKKIIRKRRMANLVDVDFDFEVEDLDNPFIVSEN